jgi:hypothetical protein
MATLFWAVLAVFVLFLAASAAAGALFVDVALVFVAALIAINEFAKEQKLKILAEKCNKIECVVWDLMGYMKEKHAFDRKLRTRNEKRFFRIGEQKTDMHKKLDDNYDSLAKKIIQVENKLNQVTRFLLQERVRSGRGEK